LPNAPLLATKLSSGANLHLKYINGNAAEFKVFFQANIFGTGMEKYAAPISFMKDENGDWKVDTF